jgi:hypothetical protein
MQLRNSTTTTLTMAIFGAVATLVTFGMITMTYPIQNQVFAQQQESQAISFTVQNTTMSTQDPLPGHETHQAVVAAPPREDGKIYSGVATFTASQPVEVVVLHGYTPSQTPDQTHGEPLNAPFGNGKVAISLMKKFTDSPINAGSFAFAGNALAFHTLDGKPFTVTYTIDAEVKSPTPQ